jgi:hypothetical protein
MSAHQSNPLTAACPPTVEDLRRQGREPLDAIIASCLKDPGPTSFLDFEAALLGLLRSPGCLLIQLSLRARHGRIDPAAWQARGDRAADPAAGRTLETGCGPVTSVRAFLVPRRGGGPGVHPLDVAPGLTRDADTPLVIGWFCRLATRVSVRVFGGLGGMFPRLATPAGRPSTSRRMRNPAGSYRSSAVSPARRTALMSRAAKSAGVALPRRRSRNSMRRTPRRGRCGGRA